MDNENKNLVFDAETEELPKQEVIEPDKENVVYDLQKDINDRAEQNGLPPMDTPKEEKNSDELKVIGNTDNDGNLTEDQKNVFTDGLQDGHFIPNHRCPVCFMPKKTIRGLDVYKKIGFLRKKKERIGYMSICVNCGFTSFYTNKPEELLLYFRGKVAKS